MSDVKITTLANGPLIVEGAVQLVDSKGQPVPNPFPQKPRLALCRCGASASKPFCDGSHTKCGFKTEP